jgi:hypothetical protein
VAGVWLALVLVIAWPDVGSAQPAPERHIEIGPFVGALDLRTSVGEKPIAVGLRAGYRFAAALGVEAEFLRCPEDASGYSGQTLIVAGPKLGWRAGPVAILGKMRGGFLRIDGPHHRAYNDGRVRTEPALDVGVVVELHYSSRVALRLDAGRTIVLFGSDPIRGPLPPYSKVVGTTVNAMPSIGFQLKF